MDISRELAIQILKYLDQHKDFYFPFRVMNQEYSKEQRHSSEKDDFTEIEPYEWKKIEKDGKYQSFQLWENLQNLYEQTLELMSKGFIERITNESMGMKK